MKGNRFYQNEFDVPEMRTVRLAVAGSGSTQSLTWPGLDHCWVVLGYQINQWEDATLSLLDQATLKFPTSNKYVWEGLSNETGVCQLHSFIMSGLNIRGAENEVLTLTNTSDSATGQGSVVAVVYYCVGDL